MTRQNTQLSISKVHKSVYFFHLQEFVQNVCGDNWSFIRVSLQQLLRWGCYLSFFVCPLHKVVVCIIRRINQHTGKEGWLHNCLQMDSSNEPVDLLSQLYVYLQHKRVLWCRVVCLYISVVNLPMRSRDLIPVCLHILFQP